MQIGDEAPTFSLPGTDGREYGPEGVTVVVFTCNHCPYALAWHERLKQVARDYEGRRTRTTATSGRARPGCATRSTRCSREGSRRGPRPSRWAAASSGSSDRGDRRGGVAEVVEVGVGTGGPQRLGGRPT